MGKNIKLEQLRHSLAHLLAAAVLKLWPDTKLAIGPTIENGFYYDVDLPSGIVINDDSFSVIEKKMRQILKTWKDFECIKETNKSAIDRYTSSPYKLELIQDIILRGEPITSYKSGDFIDLCRGGHVENIKEINMDAFKLMRVAGAYWRGDSKNKMLTRIYGVAFETQKELKEHLDNLEKAKLNDHRLLGERLKLFTIVEEVGPGLPLWLPKGTVLREEIENYAKKIENQLGYSRISTPHIAKEELYRSSGHLDYYKDSMFPSMKLDDGEYYLKPMNCPLTHFIYKSEPRSYRNLPVKLAEYGTVYRYELSGTLAGLLRTRGFTQNDAHIYAREDQAEEEFLKVIKLHEFWYKEVFQIKDFYIRLSLPAKNKTKFAGVAEDWKKSIDIVRRVMKKSNLPYTEVDGEAAFYGPKADFQITSLSGREETASTNQLDFLSAKKFDLTYIDTDGKAKFVYVIHRAPLGSHERFIAFLIEHYGGAFPVWLAPVQIAIITITNKCDKYSQDVFAVFKKAELKVELWNQNETLGKKIREAELQKIPYIVLVGEKEAQNNLISIRERGKGDIGSIKIKEFIEKIKTETKLKNIEL